MQAASNDRDPDKVFQVPPNHPEIQRLQELADAPLTVGAMVELANGQPAIIKGVSMVWLLTWNVQICKGDVAKRYGDGGVFADGRRICCDRC